MPEISRFFGTIVRMFFDEHNPPHFHVQYNEYKAQISIAELTVIEGFLPPRALGLVIEWAMIHRDELMNDWYLSQNNESPKKIEPLK